MSLTNQMDAVVMYDTTEEKCILLAKELEVLRLQ